jgi:hypothetical protein
MNTAADDTALDLDLVYWLEMSEALAYEDTYAAAGSKPGNPTGATTAPVGGAIAFGLTAIDFGFFNRVVGLGTAQPATEAGDRGRLRVLPGSRGDAVRHSCRAGRRAHRAGPVGERARLCQGRPLGEDVAPPR